MLKNLLIASLGVLSLHAFASSGYTPAAGEVGFKTHAMPPSSKTRAQVTAELEAWKRNPVSADGWREVGGEVGWEFVGTPSGVSRSAVQKELAEWQRSPVNSDGWAQLGGEGGWVYVGNEARGTDKSPGSVGRTAGKAPGADMGKSMHSHR